MLQIEGNAPLPAVEDNKIVADTVLLGSLFRARSPDPGDSILMTSAPMSASMEAARGPAINTYSTIKKPLAIRTQRFKMIDLRYMMAYDETAFSIPTQ